MPVARDIKKVIVHCSDTNGGNAAAIRRFHTAPPPEGRGWSDIGYHFVIDEDGTIEPGRPETEAGSHCKGENHDSIGICLIGVKDFTPEQWTALTQLCTSLMNKYGLQVTDLYCHYEFASAEEQGKTCPNFTVDTLRNLFKWDS